MLPRLTPDHDSPGIDRIRARVSVATRRRCVFSARLLYTHHTQYTLCTGFLPSAINAITCSGMGKKSAGVSAKASASPRERVAGRCTLLLAYNGALDDLNTVVCCVDRGRVPSSSSRMRDAFAFSSLLSRPRDVFSALQASQASAFTAQDACQLVQRFERVQGSACCCASTPVGHQTTRTHKRRRQVQSQESDAQTSA